MENEVILRVAKAIAGHFGPDFDELPVDRKAQRLSTRQGDAYCDTQAEMLDAARAAIEAMPRAEPRKFEGRWRIKTERRGPENRLYLQVGRWEICRAAVWSWRPLVVESICGMWFVAFLGLVLNRRLSAPHWALMRRDRKEAVEALARTYRLFKTLPRA